MPPKAWDLGLGHPLVGEVPRPLLAEADTQQSSGKHRTARGAGRMRVPCGPWVREAPNHRPMPQGAGPRPGDRLGGSGSILTRHSQGKGLQGVGGLGRPALGARGQTRPSSGSPALPALWC